MKNLFYYLFVTAIFLGCSVFTSEEQKNIENSKVCQISDILDTVIFKIQANNDSSQTFCKLRIVRKSHVEKTALSPCVIGQYIDFYLKNVKINTIRLLMDEKLTDYGMPTDFIKNVVFSASLLRLNDDIIYRFNLASGNGEPEITLFCDTAGHILYYIVCQKSDCTSSSCINSNFQNEVKRAIMVESSLIDPCN